MKSPLRLVPGTRYHNIVNIGCGWASGVNYPSSYDWPSLLQSILSDVLFVPIEHPDLLFVPFYTAFPRGFQAPARPAVAHQITIDHQHPQRCRPTQGRLLGRQGF